MNVPQNVALGAAVGAYRSLQVWFTKDQEFVLSKFVKTVGTGILEGAATGFVTEDPLVLFGLVYIENVTLHDAWKHFIVKKKKK